MSLLKIKLLEGITTWTASFGIAAVIMGGAGCIGGLTATGIIKAGELLTPHRTTIQKALFYGGVASGSGLFLIGVASGLSVIGERMCDEEIERINKKFKQENNNNQQEINWSEFENLKKFCRGCKHYKGGGSCAIHGNSKPDCIDREAKSECTNCKYYYGDPLLPCAVHPELKKNCNDWELNK